MPIIIPDDAESLVLWDAPTPDDLAALMFARVTGEFGAMQTFTATSRPTEEQALRKIVMAMGIITPQVGFDLAAKYHDTARAIVVLTAALLMEPGYWPEDLKDYGDATEEWRKERDAALEGLLAAIKKEEDAIADLVNNAVTSSYMTRIDGNSDDISAEDTNAYSTLDGTGRVGWRFANVHGDEPIWMPE